MELCRSYIAGKQSPTASAYSCHMTRLSAILSRSSAFASVMLVKQMDGWAGQKNFECTQKDRGLELALQWTFLGTPSFDTVPSS